MGYQISLVKCPRLFSTVELRGGLLLWILCKDNHERNSHMCVRRGDKTVSSPAPDMLLDEIRHLVKYV